MRARHNLPSLANTGLLSGIRPLDSDGRSRVGSLRAGSDYIPLSMDAAIDPRTRHPHVRFGVLSDKLSDYCDLLRNPQFAIDSDAPRGRIVSKRRRPAPSPRKRAKSPH